VHPTLGILARFQAVSYALAFFWLDGFAVPAPAQVTQTDGADRFASASQIGAIGAADVPPACWPCSLRSRRAIMRMSRPSLKNFVFSFQAAHPPPR